MTYKNHQKGFLKWIIIIVIALVLASYFFDFSVQDAVEDEQTQENFDYVSEHTSSFWDEYLAEPLDYVWNDIFVDILWAGFIENMSRVRDGEPTEFEENAPTVEVNTTASITNEPISQ